MTKKSAFGVVSLLFIISIGGALPILYFDLIEPRLGVMNAHIGIAALEISAVDDASITLVIKLRIIDPSGKTVIFPKLDLIAFAGFVPLGTAWNPMEWIIPPASWLLDYNAILYLRCLRGEDAGLTPLLEALLHGSDLPLTFSGNALIGSLPFNIPPFSFSLAGISLFNPIGEIINEINEEIREEDEDIITMFFDYIQENGVDFEELAQTVTLDSEGLTEFLDSYGINVFALFYYLETGQEWYDGFGIGNNSKIENREDRLGVKQAIHGLETADPDKDILTNLLKIAWDLDDTGYFNGTAYSRGEKTDDLTYEGYIPPGTFNFTNEQAKNPATFYQNLLFGAGVNSLLRDYDENVLLISPNRSGPNYQNNANENWYIIPNDNFTIPNDKEVHYLKFIFATGPFLDIEGDGSPDTFTADNLTFSYLDTDNNSNPVTLMYDENNMLEPLGLVWSTPALPTNSVNITFKSNGAINQTGFDIVQVFVDYDTPFKDVTVGNYTPQESSQCFWLDNDTDTIDGNYKQYFNPTAFLIFDLWHQTYILNQTYGIMWETAWKNVTMKGYDVLTLLTDPPTLPTDGDFTSDGMSFWDLLWWVNYHYDVRYLLENSNSNETAFLVDNLLQLMSPLKQADFFYGDIIWNNGTDIGLIKDILLDFPTMSPAHAFVDFAPGAMFENMSEPVNYVRIWERNSTTGKLDDFYINYTHTDLYGYPDIPGTGGPYSADVSYMKTLKYNSTGFLSNMLYLALTQDSRLPGSIWQKMLDITKNILGVNYSDYEADFNITYWNTNPLPINVFLEAVNNASEAVGGEGSGVANLLYGIDTLELLEYLGDKTGTSLGAILDAAGVRTYDLIEFFAENIEPTFPPIPVDQNIFSLNELLIYLIPAFIAIPAIAIYVIVSQKQTRSEISK